MSAEDPLSKFNLPDNPQELLREAARVMKHMADAMILGQPGSPIRLHMRDFVIFHFASIYLTEGMDEFDRLIAPEQPEAKKAVADFMARFTNDSNPT